MTRPRIGFLGTGWIGRDRMRAICKSNAAVAAAICDPDEACLEEARKLAPEVETVASFGDLLGLGLDGIVIATPSSQHSEQAIAALQSGAAVFCQKPLGRDADEVSKVIGAARAADRLLSVDFSYRRVHAFEALKKLVDSGALGRIYAADLAFHNAYGPDKLWFYDRRLSGGGCLMDLGVHLVDTLLWALGFPEVLHSQAQLFSGATRFDSAGNEVEDFAFGEIGMAGDIAARLACSWRLHAGCDAVIEASFYGSDGGATVRNVNGSFYDFEALHFHGTSSLTLVSPPDQWGGRLAADWAIRLQTNPSFDPAAGEYRKVAETLDLLYRSAGAP